MSTDNSGLIDIHQMTQQDIFNILNLSDKLRKALKNHNSVDYKLAKEKDLLVASLFYENSTRTRSSFEIAAIRLGLNVTGFGSIEGSSVKKGESLGHTLDMFDSYLCDAVILRHPLDGSSVYASERISVPVFNAGDGKHQHPTQTMLDLYTISRHLGRLENFSIGFGGDLKYGRTSHSLVLALSRFENISFYFYSHPSLAMPDYIVDALKESKCNVTICNDLEEAAETVDIFYMTRIQKERLPDIQEYEMAKKTAVFTPEIMAITGKTFGLMHPLPIDKSAPGILPELDSHPKSLYKRQAGNGVPVRMALLAASLGLVDELSDFGKRKNNNPKNDFIRQMELNPGSRNREGVSIRPIRKCGVVIDHLVPWTENILINLLNVRERRDIYRSATVRSISRPDNIKGMLMIENRELNTDELKIIATVSPGARVNVIHESTVVKKLELQLPDIVEDIRTVRCPNHGCISNPEHMEHVAPKFHKISSTALRCHYCSTILPSSDLFILN
ncbi:MAG: aspartate carbamoyltransferase [Deltaproteobacteria bacterium]|nr:aspartate carbamoyltransferase [Deltaproteobacteria bacterium]